MILRFIVENFASFKGQVEFNTFPSRIFVYEPDTKLIHFVLNNVDISDHLKSGRVFIYDDLDALINKLSDIYLTKDKVEDLYLKNYAIVKSQELLSLTQKVYEACKSKTVDVNTITRYSQIWLDNTLNNISKINEGVYYKLSGHIRIYTPAFILFSACSTKSSAADSDSSSRLS